MVHDFGFYNQPLTCPMRHSMLDLKTLNGFYYKNYLDYNSTLLECPNLIRTSKTPSLNGEWKMGESRL